MAEDVKTPESSRCGACGSTLSDYELISLITGSSLDIARNTLEQIGGLKGLALFNPRDLVGIKGLTRKKAEKIIALAELTKRFLIPDISNKPVIRSPADVWNLVEQMRCLDREEFRILHLNTKHYVLEVETISVGSLNSSIVHPREVFKNAIKRSTAAIILVHNHPSGDTSPSREDIEVTKRLVEVGKIIGIDVLDHLIVGNNRYVSLKEKDLI